jgi:hypothetical protein
MLLSFWPKSCSFACPYYLTDKKVRKGKGIVSQDFINFCFVSKVNLILFIEGQTIFHFFS